MVWKKIKNIAINKKKIKKLEEKETLRKKSIKTFDNFYYNDD